MVVADDVVAAAVDKHLAQGSVNVSEHRHLKIKLNNVGHCSQEKRKPVSEEQVAWFAPLV